MKRWLTIVLSLAMVSGAALAEGPISFPTGGTSSGTGTTNASDLTSGTLPAARIGDNSVTTTKVQCSGTKDNTTFLRMDGTCAAPTGTGTVTEVTGSGGITVATGTTTPALSLTDNSITNAKILDNTIANAKIASDAAIDATKIADGTVTSAEFQYLGDVTGAIQSQLDAKAPLVSPSFTTPTLGAATATSINTGQGANLLYQMNQNLRTTDNVVFGSVTTDNWVTTCISSDNACGISVANDSDPTGANLEAGQIWVTDNAVKVRANDNSVTFIAGAMIKAFPIIIDNVVATDNILLFRVPRAITLLRADCYASVDNVVGSLMECATDNVTNCSVLDAWTVTNAVSPFTDSSMTDGAVAAGAWLRWSTTSVGTTSVNRLSCTVQYRE